MSDNAGGIASRPSTLAECLVVLKARLSDHLSPAENREIDEAIRFVCGYDSCAPKGWKLVPLQPTAEMLKAGAYSTISSDSRTAIYAAMLAVAPDAPFDEIPQGWGDVRSESPLRQIPEANDLAVALRNSRRWQIWFLKFRGSDAGSKMAQEVEAALERGEP